MLDKCGMYKNKKILVVIPARGGSKRLPGKNIRNLNGKPLISYAIKAAIGSKFADRIIVSTDDKKIALTAKKYGAEVPFMRPAELASDTAMPQQVLQHAVKFFQENKNFKPDIIVMIQPTSPLVQSADVDEAVKKMISKKKNTCVSVSEISQRPEWMYRLEMKKPELFIKKNKPMAQRSQELPKLGVLNGAVYVMKYNSLMQKGILIDNSSVCLYVMPKERSVDIDELFDLELAEFLMSRKLKQ